MSGQIKRARGASPKPAEQINLLLRMMRSALANVNAAFIEQLALLVALIMLVIEVRV